MDGAFLPHASLNISIDTKIQTAQVNYTKLAKLSKYEEVTKMKSLHLLHVSKVIQSLPCVCKLSGIILYH